jgi:hypothetical protein
MLSEKPWAQLSSLKIEGRSRLELIIKLLAYSFIYGLFMINVIDLTIKGFWGYHIFLIMMYFFPFLIACLILGFDDWELLAGLGLISSLMNDLFYAPVGNLFFSLKYDLLEWYVWQLGFCGLNVKWCFNGGFFTIPVSSLLMGLSIYARIILAYLVLLKWWRE